MFGRIRMIVVFFCLAFALIAAATVTAGGAKVTAGAFQTYAAGLERGYDVSGYTAMVRTADGRTLVKVQARGLAPAATYPVHVHNAPCDVNNGGGHYQHEVGGAVDAVNEIWPGFTTNSTGQGSGFAENAFTARPEAQAVVIHDLDGARIACADLE